MAIQEQINVCCSWPLNNITAYRLLTAHCEVSSDSYYCQTTNNFEKLLDLGGTENTSMITSPILLILHIYIGPTRFFKDGALNAKFDVDQKLCLGSTNLDQNDSGKIKEAITVDKDDKDEEEDPREKNK